MVRYRRGRRRREAIQRHLDRERLMQQQLEEELAISSASPQGLEHQPPIVNVPDFAISSASPQSLDHQPPIVSVPPSSPTIPWILRPITFPPPVPEALLSLSGELIPPQRRPVTDLLALYSAATNSESTPPPTPPPPEESSPIPWVLIPISFSPPSPSILPPHPEDNNSRTSRLPVTALLSKINYLQRAVSPTIIDDTISSTTESDPLALIHPSMENINIQEDQDRQSTPSPTPLIKRRRSC